MAKSPIDGASVVQELEHYKVHKGDMFSWTYSATIASGNTQNLAFRTGTKCQHTVFDIQCSGAATLNIYEGVTCNSYAGTITIYNMNRESSKTTTATAFNNIAFSTNSEKLIHVVYLPGGATPQTRAGAGGRQNTEWIFNENTNYMLQFVNLAGANNVETINLQFYTED